MDRGVYLFISEIFQRHSFYLLQVKALFFRYVCVHISVHRYDTPTLSLRPSLLTCHSSCDGDCVYLISNVLLYLSFVAWILYSWITQKVRAKTITRYPPESRSRAVVVCRVVGLEFVLLLFVLSPTPSWFLTFLTIIHYFAADGNRSSCARVFI